ncbi:hypothetical protein [Paenirhodobacter sp. CAU 1674]|nr:hypothetical protein [Paenirhodobacter sp. CAU 1674]MDF2141476.1 hypothetical protein [Paenirhodobacter sp. CAU 1674]
MQQKLYALSFGFVALLLAVQHVHAEAIPCGQSGLPTQDTALPTAGKAI